MTVVEIKSEIKNLVETIPDNAVEGAFQLLKEYLTQSEEDEKIDSYFKKVVDENRGLLQRLSK